ncbi:pyridoxal phosphate-dependent decarboxylase family protein [Nitratireductor soli]|uniref:pyridoxal phosphate-dependent decarboxylase family protein n=1 Tax=Nitratireductor soli TaxID=1670619 RepID=UPI0009E56366|nr:pyridoxal-dependent decarboxylase [Nitratireductor soli]
MSQMINWPGADEIERLAQHFADRLNSIRSDQRPIPLEVPAVTPPPKTGGGSGALSRVWGDIVDGAAQLGAPSMSGHMDTAPHPYAVLTQALVSAFNNNMLFRELSPFASNVEETLIDFFIGKLGLGADWAGTWASGGSLANLTALFCALGGYEDVSSRSRIVLFLPESGHASLAKSAAVLGLSADQIIRVACDDAGRVQPEALRTALFGMAPSGKAVVTSVLGTTIHGSVDDIRAIGAICREFGAWHHIDAIYGAALMFSAQHRAYLDGIAEADSIVLGPQKWMYVPRVSAVVLIRGTELFDRRLGVAMPYSISDESHRGQWGLQGSRPADALVLWALLQAIGTDALGEMIDGSIALTQTFHAMLAESDVLRPTHTPDLNLQIIAPSRDAAQVQRRLTEAGGFWASLSRWRNENYLRAVLLSPMLTREHIANFVNALEDACS